MTDHQFQHSDRLVKLVRRADAVAAAVADVSTKASASSSKASTTTKASSSKAAATSDKVEVASTESSCEFIQLVWVGTGGQQGRVTAVECCVYGGCRARACA